MQIAPTFAGCSTRTLADELTDAKAQGWVAMELTGRHKAAFIFHYNRDHGAQLDPSHTEVWGAARDPRDPAIVIEVAVDGCVMDKGVLPDQRFVEMTTDPTAAEIEEAGS